jgi:hypothetical protein
VEAGIALVDLSVVEQRSGGPGGVSIAGDGREEIQDLLTGH